MKNIKIHLDFQYSKFTTTPMSLNRTFLMKLDVKKDILNIHREKLLGRDRFKGERGKHPAVDYNIHERKV